jgi:hypothetical protein
VAPRVPVAVDRRDGQRSRHRHGRRRGPAAGGDGAARQHVRGRRPYRRGLPSLAGNRLAGRGVGGPAARPAADDRVRRGLRAAVREPARRRLGRDARHRPGRGGRVAGRGGQRLVRDRLPGLPARPGPRGRADGRQREAAGQRVGGRDRRTRRSGPGRRGRGSCQRAAVQRGQFRCLGRVPAAHPDRRGPARPGRTRHDGAGGDLRGRAVHRRRPLPAGAHHLRYDRQPRLHRQHRVAGRLPGPGRRVRPGRRRPAAGQRRGGRSARCRDRQAADPMAGHGPYHAAERPDRRAVQPADPARRNRPAGRLLRGGGGRGVGRDGGRQHRGPELPAGLLPRADARADHRVHALPAVRHDPARRTARRRSRHRAGYPERTVDRPGPVRPVRYVPAHPGHRGAAGPAPDRACPRGREAAQGAPPGG